MKKTTRGAEAETNMRDLLYHGQKETPQAAAYGGLWCSGQGQRQPQG